MFKKLTLIFVLILPLLSEIDVDYEINHFRNTFKNELNYFSPQVSIGPCQRKFKYNRTLSLDSCRVSMNAKS